MRRLSLATLLAALVVAETGTTVIAAATAGLSWQRLLDLFVVTNTLIGVTLAASGWPIARFRPANPVGWWLLSGGVLYGATATGLAVLSHVDASTPWRVLATITNGTWAVSLSLCLPMALLLFPDGHLPGRGWRWLIVVIVTGAVLFTGFAALEPKGGLSAEVGVPGYPVNIPLGTAGTLLMAVGYLTLPIALLRRYRQGSEVVRRQVLWPVLAVLVMVACFSLEALLGLETLLLGVLPIVGVPVAITIAVLRHRLLDIRLVVSRSLLYLLLTGGVVAVYLALVSVLPTGSPILAALVVAVAFNPARVWLQRLVDRAFYGARGDPVRAFAEVGARLTDESGLAGVLAALCRVMRFPAAAITVGDRSIATHGSLSALETHAVALSGDGSLIVGLRSGETRPDPADMRVLDLLAALVDVAVQLTASRERAISSREEERRRIRRDLHDGLGPLLTGVVLNADAAWHLLETQPRRSADLIATVRDQTVTAIEDIRRLVYGLRPPALDGLGLVGALREYAVTVSSRDISVTVEADVLDELPAAVEVAAYRIATEAITNAARHSGAAGVVVTLRRSPGSLSVSICDDGGLNKDGGGLNSDDGVTGGHDWRPGVGLHSMRERASELGGTCLIDHDRDGARVHAQLPLPS